MIGAALTILWVSFVLLLTGWRTLSLIGIGPRDDRLAFLGWAVAVGALVQGMVLFGLALFGALVPLPVVLAQTGLILALGHLRRRRPVPAPQPAVPTSGSRAAGRCFQAAVILVLCVCALRILVGDLTPALSGDEGMLWGFKARAIAAAGGLGPEYLSSMARPALRHADYPLLNPLLQAWVLVLDGGGALLLRLPLQLGALGLLCTLAAALRRAGGPLVAAALLVSFAASPLTRDACQTAGAEGLVALGLLVAVDAFARFERDRRGAWLALAACGLGLALFTKNDAQLFVVALFAGGAARALTFPPARVHAKQLCWILVPLFVLVAGAAFNAHAGFQNDLTTGKGDGVRLLARLGAHALDYLPTTAMFFADQAMTSPRFDGLTLVLLGLVLFITGTGALAGERAERASLGRALCPSLTVLVGLMGLFLIYLATPQPLEWHLASSTLRVTWQLLPVAAVALATLLASSHPNSAPAEPTTHG